MSHFTETIKILGTSTKTVKEAKDKVRRLKKLNKKPRDNTRLQMVLDFLGSPTMIGFDPTMEEVQAFNVLQKGYWESITDRNKKTTPKIEQHLHIHMSEGQSLEELRTKTRKEIERLKAKAISV